MADTGLKFLYETLPGRLILRALISPGLSAACGRFLDSRISRKLVPGFIRRNRIDMADYEPGPFPSFNAFFSRHLRDADRRPFVEDPAVLTAPCDGLLTCIPIEGNTLLPVKQSCYDLPALLDDQTLAAEFTDGICLVYRLCVDNYHRYAFFDGGTCAAVRKIPGRLHTVRPIALRNVPVFTENAREYAVLDTDGFGRAVQMEVGALLVGKIANHPIACYPAEDAADDTAAMENGAADDTAAMENGAADDAAAMESGAADDAAAEPGHRPITRFRRGQEKGCFLYGGSTIIVLLRAGSATIDPALLEASAAGQETPVRMGQAVGRATGQADR